MSYIEISKQNLLHNISMMRTILNSDIKLGCVVKANAYGHGLTEVVQAIHRDVDYFIVDDFDELQRLRSLTTNEIIVIGHVPKHQLREALSLNPILVIYDTERLDALQEAADGLNITAIVHIKNDAQLGRQGVMLDDLDELLEAVKNYDRIKVTGTYAHFANIEDTSDFSHAQKQIDEFSEAQKIFKDHGFKNLDTHIASTSGILAYEQEHQASSIVRFGIGLYGLWPSEDLQKNNESVTLHLKPVLRWITHVAQIKTVPANYTIGYGLTHKTTKPTRIAVIPQGYSDGYDRGLSNSGEVLIRGQRCPVLGRISMNIFTVDVTHLDEVVTEDEVVLLGSQGAEVISAEEIASKSDTINYEVVARISPLLSRITI